MKNLKKREKALLKELKEFYPIIVRILLLMISIGGLLLISIIPVGGPGIALTYLFLITGILSLVSLLDKTMFM